MAGGSIPTETRGVESVQPVREELPTTSIINIFAITDTVTKTHKDCFTKGGWGYSSTLVEPEVSKETYYRWEGQLHPNAAERGVNRSEYVKSYNVKTSIEELAENFAQNSRDTQDPGLKKRGKDSYSLKFQPTKEQIDELMKTSPSNVERVVRDLTSEERERFMDAFRKANKAATGKK